MRNLLSMRTEQYDRLVSHLLGPGKNEEEGAFLFVRDRRTDVCTFELIDMHLLCPSDFDEKAEDYLELSDETRAAVIKRAHDLGASLVEVHSHVGGAQAEFSLADHSGLHETVPHMWWRLKKPYIAIVFTRSGFDALVWRDAPDIAQSLDAIAVDGVCYRPTNRSLRYWK